MTNAQLPETLHGLITARDRAGGEYRDAVRLLRHAWTRLRAHDLALLAVAGGANDQFDGDYSTLGLLCHSRYLPDLDGAAWEAAAREQTVSTLIGVIDDSGGKAWIPGPEATQ